MCDVMKPGPVDHWMGFFKYLLPVSSYLCMVPADKICLWQVNSKMWSSSIAWLVRSVSEFPPNLTLTMLALVLRSYKVRKVINKSSGPIVRLNHEKCTKKLILKCIRYFINIWMNQLLVCSYTGDSSLFQGQIS